MQHANATLTPRGRLAWRRASSNGLVVTAGRGTVPGVAADRQALGGRYRQRDHVAAGDRSDGRSAQPAASSPTRDSAGRWCARSVICAASGAGDRPGSRIGSACIPRPWTRCCAARACLGWPTWIWRPDEKSALRCGVTSGIGPGELVHVDIKKLGKIPAGGGHRVHGRASAPRNSRRTTALRNNCHPVIGYGYVHTAVDDHSRLAYSEVLPDETAETTPPGGAVRSPGSPRKASPSSGC